MTAQPGAPGTRDEARLQLAEAFRVSGGIAVAELDFASAHVLPEATSRVRASLRTSSRSET